LIAFVVKFSHLRLGKEMGLHNELNPAARLPQLLQTDAELVDEVFSTFSATCLRIVRCRGCPASDKLASDVPSQSSFRQSINHCANPCRKIQESFRQFVVIKLCHPRSPCQFTLCIFHSASLSE
jgi:hypothetical protein